MLDLAPRNSPWYVLTCPFVCLHSSGRYHEQQVAQIRLLLVHGGERRRLLHHQRRRQSQRSARALQA